MWVACFNRPQVTASSLRSSATALGPYLNFGCLSPRLLYWKVDELYRKVRDLILCCFNCIRNSLLNIASSLQIYGADSKPPVSIHGELMLREFYYLTANLNKHFDRVQGNPLSLQIPWKPVNLEDMKRVSLVSVDVLVLYLCSLTRTLDIYHWGHRLRITLHCAISVRWWHIVARVRRWLINKSKNKRLHPSRLISAATDSSSG